MKDIKGYEGLYAVTSCGKVWSYRSKKFLKLGKNYWGYKQAILSKNGKTKAFSVHRLVAEAYIPNPDNKPQVNHKNEVKTDNYINNLEWVTHKENCNYGTHNERISEKLKKVKCKPVLCVELNKVFESTLAAEAETGVSNSNISSVCNGRRKTAGGYHWQYTEDIKNA